MDELVVNVMNTPVEAIESEFPVRVERYELARDSGGPGKFRGGLGVRRQWRILADETSVNLRMDRFKFSSAGVFGAKPARASKAVFNPGSPSERALTSKVAGLRLKRGDLLSVEFAGGGGWGDPHQRESERVREDVARGYVSLRVRARRLRRRARRRPRRRRRRDRAAAGREDRAMKLRVGIDVGGTFTDVTAFDEDQGELVAVRKYVSNPAQPAAVMETITAISHATSAPTRSR